MSTTRLLLTRPLTVAVTLCLAVLIAARPAPVPGPQLEHARRGRSPLSEDDGELEDTAWT
ncbi:hypothetical protein BCR44DRAFT_54653 [Catenaria anguillulae PL171]|uniref:Uncharacterized protein n=1 Tax=Catenaria anguillulae PL171 TaxID=765915 RepID=A0A1Y2HYU8_9FUNG|nr:hypothetical protein BCR44DRAFT_54653 [Catenaria anguillulae PL171]